MELHFTSTIRLHGVHTNNFTFSVKNPYKNLSSNHTCDDQVFWPTNAMFRSSRYETPGKWRQNTCNSAAGFLITLMPDCFICSCSKFLRFLFFWLPSCMIFCVCSYTSMCKMFRQESPDFNSVKTRCCLWVVFEQPCSLCVEMWKSSALQRVISRYGTDTA